MTSRSRRIIPDLLSPCEGDKKMNQLSSRELLVEKLGTNLANAHRNWLSWEKENLIGMSEEIAAARYLAEAIPNQATEQECRYLLRFKNPLAVLCDAWIENSGYQNAVLDDELSHMIWRLADTGEAEQDYELEANSEAPDERKTITQEEADVMTAKHVLWLHDEGGERADFSGMRLQNLDLRKYQLNSAVFHQTEFRSVNMKEAEFCFADFSEAKFFNCLMNDATAEEADFRDASFSASNLNGLTATHSNLSRAVFIGCRLENLGLQNCCLDGTGISEDALQKCDTRGISRNENEWLDPGQPTLSL
jgi:hypothetical protein